MLYKIKNRKIRNILYIVLCVILILPFCLSLILYFTSKLIRALSYLLIFKWYSAKHEMRNFWSIDTSFSDIF